jgi:DNA-binding beta-propeller fold protein YncE
VEPTGLYLDGATGTLWVATGGSDSNVTLFDLATGRASGAVALPGGAHALASDGENSTVVIANREAGNLSLVDASTGSFLRSFLLGVAPALVTVDPDSGNLYSVDGSTGALVRVTPDLSSVAPLGLLPTGGSPAAAPDPAQGSIWIGSEGSTAIVELNGSLGSVVRTLDENATVGTISYDSIDQRLYAGNYTSDTVIPFAASNGYPNPGVAAVPTPISSFYDARNGDLYVGSASVNVGTFTSPLAILNGTREVVVRKLNGGIYLDGMTFDPYTGQLFVAAEETGNLTVINTLTNRVSGQIVLPGGGEPSALVFDPVTGLLYVAEAGSQDVLLYAPNGTFLATVPVGYDPTSLAYDYVGGFVVAADEAGGVLSILPDPYRYAVIFSERGLTPDVPWGVAAQDTVQWTNGTTLTYYTLNGSFAWDLDVPVHFNTTGGPVNGSVAINGGSALVQFQFTRNGTRYPVQLYERGLPLDTAWSVRLNGSLLSTTGTTLVDRLQNWTYPLLVPGIPGYYPTPSNTTIVVNGGVANLTIGWNQTTFPVTFSESGLAAGTSWTVTAGTTVGHSSNGTIVLQLWNGSFPFVVPSVSGYTANPSAGDVDVVGKPTNVSIAFSLAPQGVQVPPTTTPFNAGPLLLGLAVVGFVLVAVALLLELRARRAKPAVGSPPGPALVSDAPSPPPPAAAPSAPPADPNRPSEGPAAPGP